MHGWPLKPYRKVAIEKLMNPMPQSLIVQYIYWVERNSRMYLNFVPHPDGQWDNITYDCHNVVKELERKYEESQTRLHPNVKEVEFLIDHQSIFITLKIESYDES